MREAQSLPCCWRRVSAIAETHTLFEKSVPVKSAQGLTALRNTPGRILPGSRRPAEAGRCGRTGTGLTQGDERRDVSFLAADTWRPGQRSAWAKNYRGGFECWRREGGQRLGRS